MFDDGPRHQHFLRSCPAGLPWIQPAKGKAGAWTMATKRFFEECQEQSQVKARIVEKYFRAWAKVVIPRARDHRIAYIDLFA
jgi:hypothetical protein